MTQTKSTGKLQDARKIIKAKSKKKSKVEGKAEVLTLKEGTAPPRKKEVEKFVSALLGIEDRRKEASDKKELFADDGKRVMMQIGGIKLPRDDRQQLLRIHLPHCCVPEPKDVCLIVKDLKKGIKPDHEPTVNYFQDLLKERNAAEIISQVLPLRELKVEYKQYEAKNSLSQKFDIFLADERIVRLINKHLGKAFYSRKKFPVPVNLESRELKKKLETAIKTAILPLSHHGTCSMVQVGNTKMSAEQITENVDAVIETLSRRYPGGWKNIRSLHLKSEKSLSIPIYTSIGSSNDVGYVDADVPQKIKKEKVTGELSTRLNTVVTVTPFGNVFKEKMAKPNRRPEANEPFQDELEEDEEDSEDDDNCQDGKETKYRKLENGKGNEKTNENGEKKDKKKRKVAVDSDDEINEAEMRYMKHSRKYEKEHNSPKGANDLLSHESSDDAQGGEEDDDEEGSEANSSEQEELYDDQQHLNPEDIILDSDGEEECEEIPELVKSLPDPDLSSDEDVTKSSSSSRSKRSKGRKEKQKSPKQKPKKRSESVKKEESKEGNKNQVRKAKRSKVIKKR